MAELSGEPWRGLTKILLDGATGDRAYTVSVVDVAPLTATGDQATWEGTPGGSLTLRFEWDTSGAPTFGQADTVTIRTHLPGGAATGSTWSPAISGGSGSVTRTFHFDTDPLDTIAGTARAGMLEVFLQVQLTGIGGWGPADSRGASSALPVGVTHDWARGYLRAPLTMNTETLSNVSLGGAEPSTWAYPDPIHAQATLDSVTYENTNPTFSVRDTAVVVRSGQPGAGTGVTKSVSFTVLDVVDDDFDVDTDDVRWALAANDFGGDNRYVWAASGHPAGWTRTSELILDDAARMVVDPRLRIFSDSGLTTPGVLVHDDSGRTNLSALFTRGTATATLAPHSTPRMRCWVANARGALASTNVTARVLDSDGTSENSQNLTTDANGRISWEYTVGATHKAFNRFKRTSPDDPDALGTHDALFTAHKPSGSKTNTYPDPTEPTTDRDFGAASYPARAKDIEVEGRTGAGDEPGITSTDEFGVSSEVIFEGMWSGSTTDRTTDANGVPDGPVSRSKPTAGGSFAFKTASLIDETAFGVADATQDNPTDVAGRHFNFTAVDQMFGRRAVFDTTNANADDTGTNLTAQERLDTPQGYSVHASPASTFDTLAAPSDATTFHYYQGFSSDSTQRATFGITAANVAGFTSDSRIYGYKRQTVDYTVVRDDLTILLAVDNQSPYPGQDVVVTVSPRQILPDNTLITSTFDGVPRIIISKVSGTDSPLVLEETSLMTPVTGSDDYEYTFTPDDPAGGAGEGFNIAVIGKLGGSRPPAGTAQVESGAQNPAIDLIVDVAKPSGGDLSGHLVPGEDARVAAWMVDDDTDQLVAFDQAPAAILTRAVPTTGEIEYLDSSDVWQTLSGGGTADEHTMTLAADGEHYFVDISLADSSWDLARDFVAHVKGLHRGVFYFGSVYREVTGDSNAHSGSSFDAVAFATGGGVISFK